MNTDATYPTQSPELRRLQRSRSNRKLAGVSGGLADYFGIHPAVFRVGFVVLTFLGCAGIIIYAAAALVMPDEGKQDSLATAALRDRRDRPWPLIGLGLLAVAGIALLSHVTLWPGGDSWAFFLVAGAVILWITRHPAADPALSSAELAAEDSRRVRRAGRRIVIVVASLVALILVAAAIFVAVFDVHLGRGVGDRSYAVQSTQELRRDYRLGMGSLKLDLSALQLPPGETRIDTSVDVGEVRVILPRDTGLRIRGSAQLGEVDLPGGTDGSGRHVEASLLEAGSSVLVLDAHVGLGSITVERAVP